MRERTAFPRAVLEALPRLKLLVTTGMRNASVDAACLSERGVLYCGTGGGSAAGRPGIPGTAEIAWALILATTKRVTIEDRAIRAGHWQTGLPVGLAGATLGLAGLGNLGSAMVGPARAFGMDVIAWSPNLTAERASERGVRAVAKADLLSGSDVLSVHLVLSDRTRGLFQAADLALMKRSAVLINTSRGPIVDEQALIGALRNDVIAGAPALMSTAPSRCRRAASLRRWTTSCCCRTWATSPSRTSGRCTARPSRTSRASWPGSPVRVL